MRAAQVLVAGLGVSASLAYEAPEWLPKANGSLPVLPKIQRPVAKKVDFLAELTSLAFGIFGDLVLNGLESWLFPKGQPSAVDLSAQALQQIEEIMQTAIDNAFLSDYNATAKTLIQKAGSESGYFRRTDLYEKYPDSWPVFWTADDKTITEIIEEARLINNKLNSNPDFGLVPIKTYQLIAAIRVAYYKERIGLYRWANSTNAYIARIQCDLSAFASEAIQQLDVEYRSRYKWHHDTLFKTREVSDGICYGYKYDPKEGYISIHMDKKHIYVDRKKSYRWSDSQYEKHQDMGTCCIPRTSGTGYSNTCPALRNTANSRAASLRNQHRDDNKALFLGDKFEDNISQLKNLLGKPVLEQLYP